MPTKQCPSCHETKPLDAFYPSRTAKSGRQTYCKDCDNATRNRRAVRSDGRPWEVRRPNLICRSTKGGCDDLPHRRPPGGCPKCGRPYVPERAPDVSAYPRPTIWSGVIGAAES